jgi:hypothetical protein
VPWDIFDSAAPRYEGWYTTPLGHRVEQAERALLAWLLGTFPPNRATTSFTLVGRSCDFTL